MKRETLGSRLGFLLLSAGCAIGVGNVWKFPYVVGRNGGAVFVLIYLCCLVLLGLPVMTMEFAMGRGAGKSPVRMYAPLEPKGSKWHIHGWFALLGNVVLLMCYCTITGWIIQYFVDTARGCFVGLDEAAVGAAFGAVTVNTPVVAGYTLLVVALATAVCSFSLRGGLERVTKYMMTALLVIMVVLAVFSSTRPGAAAGISFYLKPNWEGFLESGPMNVISAAMNQAFFTLSLGIGAMAIFGSYLNKDRALMGEAVNVMLLDTFVALTAGFIVIPACFAYNVAPEAGPSLIFVTLPNIFNHLPGGRFWGSLFFVFMSFAALSTVFAVFENIVACLRDLTGWQRRKAALVTGLGLGVLTMPCVLGFTVWNNVKILGLSIMDFEDFSVNNLLLPLGALIFVLFCTSRYGWGWERFVSEANTGKGLKVRSWMRFYMTWILPVIIGIIFVLGLVNFFQ